MTRDITQDILNQLPVVIHPDSVEVEAWQIQSRLNSIDRQNLVLYIAQWLYENENALPHIDFELNIYDDRVSLTDDDVAVGDGIEDGDEIAAEVVAFSENLDAMVDDSNAGLTETLIKGLNKARWKMPQAWQVLVDHAPLPASYSAQDWLGEHRADWQKKALEQGTCVSDTPTPSRPRM